MMDGIAGEGSGLVDGWAIAAFVVYLVLILGIGVAAARFSSRGISEFFVAGRRLNRFVVALSAVTSGRSAWLLLGMTGMAYTMGASALWAAVGYTVVEGLLFLFFAPRLRRFAETYDCITLPDFFARRFQDDDGRLRMALALVFGVFLVAYVAAQFVGGGKAMAASFHVDPTVGLLLTAGFVLAYTTLGGFLAVSLTDALQGVLMLAALLGLPLVATMSMGGPGHVLAELRAFDPTLLDPMALSMGALVGFVGIGLAAPGNPHIVIRYMSIDDPRHFRYVAVVGTAWNALMALGAILIGLVGRVYLPDVAALPQADPENLLPVLAQAFLPAAFFGMVVAAIFAAIMSTADSQLLVMASTLVRDLYQQLWKNKAELTDESLVRLSRIVVTLLVVVSVVLGLVGDQLVFWLVLFAVAGLGGALGPPSLLAIFWKRTTRAGVFAGMGVGAGTAVVWFLTPALKAMVYELVPAFALGLLATVVVSLFTRPPDDVEELFHAMESKAEPPRPTGLH